VEVQALKGRHQNGENGFRPFRAWPVRETRIHRALPCANDVWPSAKFNYELKITDCEYNHIIIIRASVQDRGVQPYREHLSGASHLWKLKDRSSGMNPCSSLRSVLSVVPAS
jgi:hypothetical protein